MNLLAPLQPVADVIDLAGEAVAALGIVTVTAATRWLPLAGSSDATGDRPALHIVTAGPAPTSSTGHRSIALTRDPIRSDRDRQQGDAAWRAARASRRCGPLATPHRSR